MSMKEKPEEKFELVMKITEDIQNNGHHLTADRGYSSMDIAEALYVRDTSNIVVGR